jgi:hypothetical protein
MMVDTIFRAMDTEPGTLAGRGDRRDGRADRERR